MKGYVVYYLHYKDPELRIPDWNKKPDYLKLVGAKDQYAALEWVKSQFDTPIKPMGFGLCKLEDCEIILEN